MAICLQICRETLAILTGPDSGLPPSIWPYGQMQTAGDNISQLEAPSPGIGFLQNYTELQFSCIHHSLSSLSCCTQARE